MDEEDLREAEESQLVSTTDHFAGFGAVSNPGQGASFMDIFRPIGDSVGAKLLRRMGWKEGQGIGPHVRRAADLGEGQVSQNKSHTFAPADVPLVTFASKIDSKGLGHAGASDSTASEFATSDKSKGARPSPYGNDDLEEESDSNVPQTTSNAVRDVPKVRKRGFGVGVLNDTGSDDEDPFSMGPKISYTKTIGGEKNQKKRTSVGKQRGPNPTLHKKPVLLSQKLQGSTGILRKCKDGTLPLDGFQLGDEIDAMADLSLKNDRHKPPSVPPGWRSSIVSKDDSDQSAEYKSTSDVAKASRHTSTTRASALGESRLPGKSVFDYLSAAARDRVASTSGRSDLPPGLGEASDGQSSKTEQSAMLRDLVPKLDQNVALLALRKSSDSGPGWMPYAEDLAKRERYKAFLEIRAGLRPTDQGDEIPPRAAGMSTKDWTQEMHEFSRAAEVFQPVSGLMASRFTSATSTTPANSAQDNVPGQEPLLTHKRLKPENPAESAAKMGMFGHMTRSTTNFYPSRLLCKRFGVAMPEKSDRTESDAAQSFAEMSASASVPAKTEPVNPVGPQTDASPSSANVSALPETVVPIVDPDQNDAVEAPRPAMDLFKAVFGHSDDDEDG